MNSLYKKLHNYEIRIRKVINHHMHGEYKSIFKGTGLEFDDVRGYQYGDDVRRIDWNTSAKGHGVFIKTFKEEKDQSIFFVIDVSASQELGSKFDTKMNRAKEIMGVLTLAAVKQGSQVGAICFSDQKEAYIKPGKGIKHAYDLINQVFSLKPKAKKTNLNDALKYTLGLIKRKSIIILISDFIDEGYEKHYKSMANRHDFINIHIYDHIESKFPKLGIVPLKDKESGKRLWVNTSSSGFKKKTQHLLNRNISSLKTLGKKYQVDHIEIDTQEDYVPKLIELFKLRNLRWKRG